MADYLLPPEAAALLDAISGPESKGKYNARYPSTTFSGFADHPRTHSTIKKGPNKGKTSSAAGRYQITETTWDDQIQPALNLPDFSPESQDIAAWWLAQQDYRRNGGGDLLGDLRSGDPAIIGNVGKRLSGTWTSLPGGIEAQIGTGRFTQSFNTALQKRQVSPEVPGRRPDSPTAVAAIDTLLGRSDPTTTAYAPPSGSLGALTAGAPYGLAVPVPPRPALPGVPPRAATPIPPHMALPPPVPPDILARDLNAGVPQGRARPPTPPGVAPPPQLTEQLVRRYAENYVPTNQRIPPPSLSPKPRPVQTVPIDPLTGGIAAPKAADLATALESYAENQRRSVPGKPVTMTVREVNKGIPTASYPTLRPTPTPGLQVAQDMTAVGPQGPQGRGRPPPPVNRLSPNGVPVYQPSLDATALPHTPKPTAPYTGPIPGLPPKAGVVPDRLTAQPGTGMSPKLPPVAPSRRYSMAELMGTVDPKTGLEETAPTTYPPAYPGTTTPIPRVNPIDPLLPRRRPPGGPLDPARTTRLADMGDPVKLFKSPDAQLVGEVNEGRRPFLRGLMKLFTPREGQPRQGGLFGGGLFGNNNRQIATTRDVRPPGAQINTARDGLSGAQIDIAQRQARGNDNYQSLIEWAMRS